MLRKRNTLIWLTAITLCFVGIASANAVGGSAGSYDSYYDAYFVIDCYLDSNGDTWLLLWDYILDDVVCEVSDVLYRDVVADVAGNDGAVYYSDRH